MTTIKSLRAKQKEDEKTTSTALSRAEKADRQLADTRAQLKRAQDVERKNVERLRGMYKIEAANETLRREQEVANATIGSLRWELAEANARADEAVARVQTEALEEERRVGGELREKLERVQTEMGLVQEQARSEIQELKGRLEREQASSKSLLAEFTAEISVPLPPNPIYLYGFWCACSNNRRWNQSWKSFDLGKRNLLRQPRPPPRLNSSAKSKCYRRSTRSQVRIGSE